MAKRKAQGEVISTLLLILLVIAASVILISFLVPFIQDIFKQTKCTDYNGKVYITDNARYTCYDSDAKRLLLQIKFDGTLDKKDAESIKGIKILIRNETKTFDIMPPDSNPSISIAIFDGISALELPGINEERTYNISDINTRPSEVIIYPVLKDNQNCAGVAHKINFISLCV